jgi:sulfate permease, SulP family
MEMSRPVVRRRLTCRHLASKRIRSQHDRAVLAAHGERVVVFELQGVLFFGNADDLASAIQQLPPTVATVILDLRRVGDLDTSGATVLRQIARRCRENAIRLVLSHPDPKYGALLDEALGGEPGVETFPDLDAALEEAEDRVLARWGAGDGLVGLALHETDLAGGLSQEELASLTARLEPRRFAAGEALCRAGEPADRLWILTRGSVSVRVAGAHHDRRIAALGPGTSVGEMGLLDRRPRSADVVADEEVEAFVLTAADFDALLREEAHLGQSLLATIARLTAQRLRDTSEELRLAEG